MLILTRRIGESLFVGENVRITVVDVKGSQVRIGIDAPESVTVYREEIYLAILEENKRAAESECDVFSTTETPRTRLLEGVKKGVLTKKDQIT